MLGQFIKNNAGISDVLVVQNIVKVGGMAMALSMPDRVGWGSEREDGWPVLGRPPLGTHIHIHIHIHIHKHTHIHIHTTDR